MSDVEPLFVVVEDEIEFEGDLSTRRNQLLMEIFLREDYLKKASLAKGRYIFNVFKRGDQMIYSLTSVEKAGFYTKYRRVQAPNKSSVSYRLEYIPKDGFDWLNPWNFVKFIAFVAFMVAWAWAFFD